MKKFRFLGLMFVSILSLKASAQTRIISDTDIGGD